MDEFLEKFCTSNAGHLWNFSIVSFTSVLSPHDIFSLIIHRGSCSCVPQPFMILRVVFLNKDGLKYSSVKHFTAIEIFYVNFVTEGKDWSSFTLAISLVYIINVFWTLAVGKVIALISHTLCPKGPIIFYGK